MILNKCGVMGWPINHSLSPAMHNAAYQALGLTDWQYELLPTPPDIIRHSLIEYRKHGFIGVNVTVPLKQAVMPHVRPDEIATRVGAVNTITLSNLAATNTDVAGFMDDLAAHNVSVEGQRVIVLGAGGAARAVVYGLAQAGAIVAIVNRTHEKSVQLCDELGVDAMPMSLEAAARGPVSLIVNSTSVGMWPRVDESPWPDEIPFPEGVTVYDLVYRPEQTQFMTQAEAGGGRAIGGLGMLARQGAAAFQLWTGKQPPVDVMLAAARAVLQETAK